MSIDAQPSHAAAHAILYERFGLWRTIASLPSICAAIFLEPRKFFGAIGRETGIAAANAIRFFVVTLTLYVIVTLVFEQALHTVAGAETLSLAAYYTAPFEQSGVPFPFAFGALTGWLFIVGTMLLLVAYYTVGIWLTAQWFIHDAKIASVKALMIAGLYAASAITLCFCFVSLPAAYFDAQNVGASLYAPASPLDHFARLVSVTGLQAKYEALFAFLFLRSLSFTTNLRLHWGLVFTVLIFYLYALATVGL